MKFIFRDIIKNITMFYQTEVTCCAKDPLDLLKFIEKTLNLYSLSGPRIQLPSVRQQHEVRQQGEPKKGPLREQGRHHRQPHVRGCWGRHGQPQKVSFSKADHDLSLRSHFSMSNFLRLLCNRVSTLNMLYVIKSCEMFAALYDLGTLSWNRHKY